MGKGQQRISGIPDQTMNGAWQTHPSENFTKRGDVHPLFHHKKPRRDQMCAQSESGFFGLCASVFHEQNSWHRQADERSSPITVKTSANAMAYLSVTSLE